MLCSDDEYASIRGTVENAHSNLTLDCPIPAMTSRSHTAFERLKQHTHTHTYTHTHTHTHTHTRTHVKTHRQSEMKYASTIDTRQLVMFPKKMAAKVDREKLSRGSLGTRPVNAIHTRQDSSHGKGINYIDDTPRGRSHHDTHPSDHNQTFLKSKRATEAKKKIARGEGESRRRSNHATLDVVCIDNGRRKRWKQTRVRRV